jgi:alpha-1,3-glucan synthase
MARILGMDGNLQVAYDTNADLVDAWNQIFVSNDLLNPTSGDVDPRHMYGTSNFDIFRWQSLENGTQRVAVGTFLTSLVMPGIPLVRLVAVCSDVNLLKPFCSCIMAKSKIYTFSITVPSITFTGKFLFQSWRNACSCACRRQAMFSTTAWKRHGCYQLGSQQYFNMPLTKSLIGCQDDWNSLDHFDPTANTRRLFSRFFQLRRTYGVLQDGFGLRNLRKWTYEIKRPGSNNTATEMGAWAFVREELTGFQNVSGRFQDPVMLMFTNENHTTTYTFPCKGDESNFTPFVPGTIRNLFYPYDNYTTEASAESIPGREANETFGCIPTITLEPYAFKAFVPIAQWTPPTPALTKFRPGHDHRISSDSGDSTQQVTLEFNTAMDCDSVTESITIEVSANGQSAPTFGTAQCGPVSNPDANIIPGGDISVWQWQATLQNIPDGIMVLTLTRPATAGGTTTGVRCSIS